MTDLPDPSVIRCYQNHRLAINWVSFSPNNKYLASASDDKNVILWTIKGKNNLWYKYSGHTDAVNSVALTNSFMVSASKDCTARLWRLDQINDLEYSTDCGIYRCHQAPINCVDINADETLFCTASDDQTIKIWSANSTNKNLATLSGEHSNWVRHARFSKLSPFLLSSCGDDGLVCIWDTRSRDTAIKLSSKRKSTHFLSVQWHPHCEYLMSSSSSDCLIRIWDLRYEKTIQCYQVHDGFVSSTDFHSSGNYLISSSVDRTCKIFDLFEGRTLFTLKAHTGHVNCAQFSSNGEYFATAGQDHVALLWKSNLDTLKDELSDEDDIRSIAFDPETPPINSFDSDDYNSIRKQINNIRLSSDQDNTPSPRLKNNKGRTKSGLQNKNSSNNKEADNKTNENPLDQTSILKCILNQLEIITDSILDIDQRLTTLEDKVDMIS